LVIFGIELLSKTCRNSNEKVSRLFCHPSVYLLGNANRFRMTVLSRQGGDGEGICKVKQQCKGERRQMVGR